ncbi:MAG: tetratricopeptide repeat protein [Pedobacter sp.]|nr:MAG: tetratricopeptide repeat protein [Pedobacter sp.]
MLRSLVVCFLLFSALTLMGQDQALQMKLDTLLTLEKLHIKDDSVRLTHLTAISRQYMRLKNTFKAEEYASRIIRLSRRLNLRVFEAQIYYRLGLHYHGATQIDKSEEAYLKSIDLYSKLNQMNWVAFTYLNLGALYKSIPDYAKALEVSQKAISLFQKTGNETDLASCFANIAVVYEEMGQQDEALFYLNRALKIFENEGENSRGVSVVCNSIGRAYLSASNSELKKIGVKQEARYELALSFLNRALKSAIVLKDDGVKSSVYKNLGDVYVALEEKKEAKVNYQRAIDVSVGTMFILENTSSLLAMAKLYEDENDYGASSEMYNRVLLIAQKNKLIGLQRDAYEGLSSLEEKKGNFNSSLNYYKKYIDVKSTIIDEEKEREITRKKLQISFAVKEKDYQLKQQSTDNELQRQVLFAQQQQQQLRLRQQALDISDKEKSLQRLTFLSKQVELENEKRIQEELFEKEKLRSEFEQERKDREIEFHKAESKFNKNVYLFLGLLAVILLASVMSISIASRRAKKLNSIISNQKAELEKMSKVKDRIFSVVGHDMRTPVNSLISFMDLLEAGEINQQKLNRYASQLKNTLSHTSGMMENLLSWASSQMQGFRPIIEEFNLRECANEVLEILIEVAEKKNIRIENRIDPSDFCQADRNMTSLVLRNLVANAIKFTAKNGEIILSSEVILGNLRISVTDNGVGLTEDQVVTINELGFDENTGSTLGTDNERGTGIGLMLCRTFTQLMNGSLIVRSVLGQGSKFTLTLPKAIAKI